MTIDEWRCEACNHEQLHHLVDWRECDADAWNEARFGMHWEDIGQGIRFGHKVECRRRLLLDARKRGARAYARLLAERPDLAGWVSQLGDEQ